MKRCNSFDLNVDQVMTSLRQYYVGVLRKASDKLIEIMSTEIYVTVDGPNGRTAWKDDLKKSLTVVYEKIADNAIEFGVGAPFTNSLKTKVARMIITKGSGFHVGRPWIHEKPGKIVFTKDLSRRKSNARYHADRTILLPAGFNQKGNDWLENAVKKMEARFNDILTQASVDLPDSIFSNALMIGGEGM